MQLDLLSWLFCLFLPLSLKVLSHTITVTAKFGILFWCSLSRLQVGRKTGRCRKKSYWFESQSWHSLIAWWQDNGRSLIKNVILIAELPYLLKKRGLYQQQECSYHLERLELANECPFLLKKKYAYIYKCIHYPAGQAPNSKFKSSECYKRFCCFWW